MRLNPDREKWRKERVRQHYYQKLEKALQDLRVLFPEEKAPSQNETKPVNLSRIKPGDILIIR